MDQTSYERVITTGCGIGRFRVEHDREQRCLQVFMWNADHAEVESIAAAVCRMFNLGADPEVVTEAMRSDPHLFRIWTRYPGLRIARSWNPFETIVTTVLGQLVSVAFARTLISELMAAAGSPAVHPKTGDSIFLFPMPEELLRSDLTTVRTSQSRRAAIRAIAELEAGGSLIGKRWTSHAELRKLLLSLPGVGTWTAEYVAMRAFGDDDAFPRTDYCLKQELERYPDVDVNRVRPWRAYAAIALWRGYAERKETTDESVL